jgi:uncharacterized protein (DUF885 family)
VSVNRRDFLMGTSVLAAHSLLSACSDAPSATDAARTAPAEGGTPSRRSGRPGATAVDPLLEETAETLLQLFPERATTLGLHTGARAALKSRLTDHSPEGQQHIAATLGDLHRRFAAIDQDGLDATRRVHVDTILTAFDQALEGFRLPYGDVAVGSWRNAPYVVIQNVGAYLDVPRFLDSEHQVEVPADADAYLARVEQYASALDGETERLKSAAAIGVIAPDFLIDKALGQMRTARAGDPAGWGLVTSLAKRTAAMGGDYAARATRLATERIRPALDRQIAEMERHRARATSDAGVWKLRDGDAYYAWALRAGTTTRMTPDEVHQMGLEELRVLQAEMDAILKAEGVTQGTVGARMTALGRDSRYLYPDNDAGRAEIMTLLNRRVAEMRALMPRAFNTLVRGNVEVRRLPPEEEPGAPAAYGGAGTIDGSVPGKFWINLRTTALHTRYSLPTLTYHESIPGHVWQGEYEFKLPLARTLLNFNSYSEGWGLYAEQLAGELGVYDGDPVGRLGYLQSIAFRACRLVVDTGLHAKRWTREQAIRWFAETNGSSLEEVSGEVDRYCAWPGQACGYKVGHSEINRLRRKAQTDLGQRYDFKALNDAIVLGGNVPMTVLARVVDRHIAERKG